MLYEEAQMRNPDLAIHANPDTGILELLVEGICFGDIVASGTIVDLNGVGLSLDDIEFIALKLREIQKFGKRPSTCEVCGGTPYFPNVRPADKVFEEHVCSAPMHTNRPR